VKYAPPNWKTVSALVQASIFEAVAYSLGVDPGRVERHPEFASRLAIAENHAEGDSLACVIYTNPTRKSIVRLAVFREWATRIGWKLPKQFPGPIPEPMPTPAPVPPEVETTAERGERLLKRHAELKCDGARNHTRILAAEEGVCESRVRELVAKARNAKSPKPSTSGPGWVRSVVHKG
jgi:hypothetical protein